MKTLPILSWLQALPVNKRSQVLNDQAMLGYMECHHPYLLTAGERQEKTFKKQRLRNIVYEQEAFRVQEILDRHELKVLFLKGIVLIHDLYPQVGSRFMSDIDCYIDRVDFERLDDILIPHGYQPHDPKYWLGNRHKREYTLQTDLGAVCIEFHNQLFWHRDDPTFATRTANLPTLGLEETLVYLCGHYAFLHTCQKLYWLWDIYLFLKKYGDHLDERRVDKLLSYFGFHRSYSYVCKLLRHGFLWEDRPQAKNNFLMVTKHAYFNDRQDRLGYQLLKFFVKDKPSDSIRYTLAHLMK